MQEQATNLSDLKVGDEVAMQLGYSESYNIYRITNISSKGIITISTGAKYRANGSAMDKGGRWTSPSDIQPVTNEVRQAIKKSGLVRKLTALDINYWKTVDLETLETIAALIWKPEGNKYGGTNRAST